MTNIAFVILSGSFCARRRLHWQHRSDSLTGPGFADWDFSLLKSAQITERFRAQFRAEFFNILNHTNLQLPRTWGIFLQSW